MSNSLKNAVENILSSWSIGQGKTSEIAESYRILEKDNNFAGISIDGMESNCSLPHFLAYALSGIGKEFRNKGITNKDGISALFESWEKGYLSPNHHRCHKGESPAGKKSNPQDKNPVAGPSRVLTSEDYKTSSFRLGIQQNVEMLAGTFMEYETIPEKDKGKKAKEMLESMMLYVFPVEKQETYKAIVETEEKDKEILQFLQNLGFKSIARMSDGTLTAKIGFSEYQTAIAGFSARFDATKLDPIMSEMVFSVSFKEKETKND